MINRKNIGCTLLVIAGIWAATPNFVKTGYNPDLQVYLFDGLRGERLFISFYEVEGFGIEVQAGSSKSAKINFSKMIGNKRAISGMLVGYSDPEFCGTMPYPTEWVTVVECGCILFFEPSAPQVEEYFKSATVDCR